MERVRKGLDELFKGIDSDQRTFATLFGDRNLLFDDPRFSQPFNSSMPGARVATQKMYKEKGIVIEELDSDHEDEDGNDNSNSSKEPSIQHPEDDVEIDDEENKKLIYNNGPCDKVEAATPRPRNYSVHSCKVTYGGVNGAYYTSTTTRKAGTDGVVIEETKEADKTTGQAKHRISRGIHNKGHSITRKLNADGKVDTLQTLHNLDEGELAGFEEAWSCNNKGPWLSEQKQDTLSGDLFLSSSGEMQRARWMGPETEVRPISGRAKKVVRINIE